MTPKWGLLEGNVTVSAKGVAAQEAQYLHLYAHLINKRFYYKVISLVSTALYQFKALRYLNETYSGTINTITNVKFYIRLLPQMVEYLLTILHSLPKCTY